MSAVAPLMELYQPTVAYYRYYTFYIREDTAAYNGGVANLEMLQKETK